LPLRALGKGSAIIGNIGTEMIYLAVSDNIKQSNDVGSAGQVLQDLDLSLYLLLLGRLEDLDNTLLMVGDFDTFKDLRVLPTAYYLCAKGSVGSFRMPH
jgi:hypothetical protein